MDTTNTLSGPGGNPLTGQDWSGTERTGRNQKRKKKRNDPYKQVNTNPRRQQKQEDQALLGQSPGLGGSVAPTRTGTDPGIYSGAGRSVTMTAPPGSVAASFPGTGTNPFGLPAAAENPMIVANVLMKNKYGLPAGSNTGSELSTIFNPYDKIYGMGIDRPRSDVDWVNLGASLMSGTQGMGQQLDPRSLMTNAVSSIVDEVNSMKSGGAGYSGSAFNPIKELAHMDPLDALNSFSQLVGGLLKGTMPDQEIQGFQNFLVRVGQQFAQNFYQGNSGQMEADGASFITYLVQQLGPSLGL